MNVGKRISELRKKQGYTRIAFAEKIGIPHTTLRNYETGVREPGHLFLIQMSQEFGVSVDYLLGMDTTTNENTNLFSKEENNLISHYRQLDEYGKEVVEAVIDFELKRTIEQQEQQEQPEDEDHYIYIDEYALPASAGNGVYLHNNDREMLRVPLNDTTAKANFIVHVSGDSMEPKYYDGDVLLIKSQPCVDTGELGIFILNNEGYFKKWGGDRLISLNPKYKDIKFNESDEYSCKGKVIGKL